MRGKPVAEVVPIGSRQKTGLSFAELFRRLDDPGEPDPTFAADMSRLRGEYWDEDPLHGIRPRGLRRYERLRRR